MIDRLMVGLIGIVIGVGAVVYARKLVEWFGTMATAEEKLGSGGTYTAVRLIGIFIAIVSFLYLTGFLAAAVIAFVKMLGF